MIFANALGLPLPLKLENRQLTQAVFVTLNQSKKKLVLPTLVFSYSLKVIYNYFFRLLL